MNISRLKWAINFFLKLLAEGEKKAFKNKKKENENC